MPSKKRILVEKVEVISACDFEGSFEAIEKRFQEIRDKYPDYESFSLDIDYDYVPYGNGERYAQILIYGKRPETDKDRKSAAAKERQARAVHKAARKAEFEKLKEEFGDV